MNYEKNIDECITLEQKANSFFKNKKAVHLSFKKDYWKNGYIREVSSDFLILDEFLEGEIACFFLELKDIQIFTTGNKLKEEGDGRK